MFGFWVWVGGRYSMDSANRQLMSLITGDDKQKPLGPLLDGDRTIPAGNVEAAHSLVLADASAVPA